MTSRGSYRTREGAISGLFSNDATLGGIRTSFLLSAAAAAIACVIVVVACNYIFRNPRQKALRRAGVQPAVSLAAAHHPHLLFLPHLLQLQRRVYVLGNNLYFMDNVRILIIIAYTVVKLPFALRMIKASFYAIDEELEDAARNLGASQLRTFLRVKLPIILPSVLAVFALNFNALFTEYDMGATFASSYGVTYAMVIQSMCLDEGLYGFNVNASAGGALPRCSSCS